MCHVVILIGVWCIRYSVRFYPGLQAADASYVSTPTTTTVCVRHTFRSRRQAHAAVGTTHASERDRRFRQPARAPSSVSPPPPPPLFAWRARTAGKYGRARGYAVGRRRRQRRGAVRRAGERRRRRRRGGANDCARRRFRVAVGQFREENATAEGARKRETPRERESSLRARAIHPAVSSARHTCRRRSAPPPLIDIVIAVV